MPRWNQSRSARWLFIVCSIISWHTGFAQEPYFRFYLPFESNRSIKANRLFQDSRGFIWIAASSGVWKFDGIAFKNMLTDSVFAAENNTAIAEDAAGNILTGTESGKLITISRSGSKLLDTLGIRINDLRLDSKKQMWVATAGNGVLIRSPDGTKRLNTQNGLADDFCYTVAEDHHQHIWLGTDKGITVVEASLQLLKHISTRDSLPDNIVLRLQADRVGDIWCGMSEGGFCRISDDDFSVKKIPAAKNWSYGAVTGFINTGNELYIGTAQSSLVDWEYTHERRFRTFKTLLRRNTSVINDCLFDSQGNSWFLSNAQLVQTPGEKIELLNRDGELSITDIAAIATTNEVFWIADGKRLLKYESGNATEFSFSAKKPFITCLYADSAQNLWIGTYDEGAFCYNPSTRQLRNFKEQNGLVNNNVLSISEGADDIWFATLGGASRMNKRGHSTIANYNRASNLTSNYIYCVYEDAQRNVWFGTDGNGLLCMSNEKLVSLAALQPLVKESVYSIAGTVDGKIVFNASKSGLMVLQHDTLTSLPQVMQDEVFAIANHQGNMAVFGNRGITLLNANMQRIRTFGTESGLVNDDFAMNAVARDQRNNTWFASRNFLVKLSRYEYVHADTPQLCICHIRDLKGEEFDFAQTTFDHTHSYLNIEYAGLYFERPEAVFYRYRINNANWIYTRDREVSLSNLQPGSYHFELQAAIDNSFEKVASANYSFSVTPPFWERWWFMLLCVAASVAALWLFIYYRDKRMQKLAQLEKQSAQFQLETLRSQVNPHFLFNSFNTLINMIETGEKSSVDYVQRLSDFFRNIVATREKNTVPLQDELSMLKDYVALQQYRFGKNFTVEISVPDQVIKTGFIPPLTLQMLVENAVKHNVITASQTLNVRIYFDELDATIVVQNNRNKKMGAEKSTGLGLKNINERYRLLGNREVIQLSDETTFTVKLPLLKQG